MFIVVFLEQSCRLILLTCEHVGDLFMVLNTGVNWVQKVLRADHKKSHGLKNVTLNTSQKSILMRQGQPGRAAC